MHIDVYSAAYATGDDVAIGIWYITDEYDRIVARKLKRRYIKCVADLLSVGIALKSIKGDHDIVIHTPPGYSHMMLSKNAEGKWLSNPSKNIDVVEMVRNQINKFNDISIIKTKFGDPGYKKCLDAAKGEILKS